MPYLAVMRAIVGKPFGWLLAVAFPVVLTNTPVGQNGFLTASLIGGRQNVEGRSLRTHSTQ